MASAEDVSFNDAHAPHPNAVKAFEDVLHTIKSEIVKSRHQWNKHETRMWERASGLSDAELVNFELEKDLILVRSGAVSYGTIILGKIRIPAINDEEGEGFIHVRIHDSGKEEIKFHSVFHEEIKDADDHPISFRAIHTLNKPLEFFNE